MAASTKDLDALMGHLGEFGKYQCFQFILHILSALTAGIHMLSLVTVAAVPEHRCELPGIDINGTMSNLTRAELMLHIPISPTGEIDTCHYIVDNMTLPCTAWVYSTQYYLSSRTIEWGMVCGQRWMGAVAQSVFMFGVLAGAATLGNAADKYGRKTIFCWSALLQLILGVGVAFVPEYYSFLVVKFLLGIVGSAGAYITGFVLTMELVGASYRTPCGVAFQAVFAAGIMLVAGWGALIMNRQWLQVVYGLHALLLLGHWWLMDESPTWLWAQGRTKESVVIIKKALKMNGSVIEVDVNEYAALGVANNRKTDDEEPQTSAGVSDLFKTPNLRKKTLNVCFCWFANSIVYYGLSLSTGKLSGNPFLFLFLSGLVEIPSYIVLIWLMTRLGRRSLISFYMISGGTCCIIAANLAQGSAESTSVVMIGKFLIAASFAIIYNYSAELFPTVIRNSAIGIGAMCARLSGALTPFLLLFDKFDPKIPSIIFAVIALISGFLTMFLPETMGAAMPQTVLEGEKFGIGDTCFTSCLGGKGIQEKSRAGSTAENLDQLEPLEAK